MFMSASTPIVKLRIADLIPHPLNPNKMPDGYQAKLKSHIERTGNYPALIVRLHPAEKRKFQIIDGQHRWTILQALGHKLAKCEIWDVDDSQTNILLATLNRLEGQDDPYLRGTLLADLAQQFEISQLADQLPLDAAAIRKYIQATEEPPKPAAPTAAEDMPHALIIFVTAMQREKILCELKKHGPVRTLALLKALSMASAYQKLMHEKPTQSKPGPASPPVDSAYEGDQDADNES